MRSLAQSNSTKPNHPELVEGERLQQLCVVLLNYKQPPLQYNKTKNIFINIKQAAIIIVKNNFRKMILRQSFLLKFKNKIINIIGIIVR
jgi:hypothetical protein